MSFTELQTSQPVAGDLRTKNLPVVADNYHLGMPLAYKVVPTAVVAGTGDGTCTNLSAGKEVKVGDYVLTFTGALAFDVTDPDGNYMGSYTFTSPTTFKIAGIVFTLTAGTTPWVATDTVTITVGEAGSWVYSETNPEAVAWETKDLTGGAANLLVAMAGSEILETGIKDDLGVQLAVTPGMIASLNSNGIILR